MSKFGSSTADSPNYIASSSFRRSEFQDDANHDYVLGVVAHQFEKIRNEISKRTKTRDAGAHTAPQYQLTPAKRRQLRLFAEALDPYTALEDGWNGPGSCKPSQTSVAMGVWTCWNLVQNGVVAPKPKLLSDGTLGCFWVKDRAYATMDFEEDGEHVWTVTDGTTFKSGTWKSGESIPQAINLQIAVE